MIATIVKTPLAGGFLNIVKYNEDKVKSGEGERLINSTGSLEPSEMVNSFKEQLQLNPLVYKNQLAKIVVSFSPDDTGKLNESMLTSISDEVFKQMGYEGAVLAYYHTDREHHHLHLYATTVDADGIKIKEFQDYDKLEELMRSAEISHQLEPVIESERTGLTIAESQSIAYRLHDTLANDPATYERAAQFIRKSTLDELLARPLDNQKLLDRVGEEFGNEAQKRLTKLIPKESRKRLNKHLLIEKLDPILEKSTSSKSYFSSVTKTGIYARIVYNSKGKPGISYGMKDQAFYISERNMPVRFQLKKVNTLGKTPDPVAQEKDKQRTFIRNQVFKSLNVSASLYQLENSLYLRGVRVITHSNASGIYGLSFESRHVSNPISFKGSEIHRSLSFKNIQDRILKNSPAFDSTFYEEVAKTVRHEKQQSVTKPMPKAGKLARKLDTNEENEERMRNPGLEH